MYKVFFLILICFYSVIGLQAQNQAQIALRLGVGNTLAVGGDAQASRKINPAFQGGLSVRKELFGNYYQTGLLVSSRSYAFTQAIQYLGKDTLPHTTLAHKKIKATYLDIPLLIEMDVNEQLRFLVGPQLSLNMGFNQTVEDTVINHDAFVLNFLEFGATAGVMYLIPSGIDFSLRAAYGISPLLYRTNDLLLSAKRPAINNLGLYLTVGLPIKTNSAEDDKNDYSNETVY